MGIDRINLKRPKSRRESIKFQIWRYLVQKSVSIIFVTALFIAGGVVCVIGLQDFGPFFVVVGLSVSFVGTIILAVPSTPMLKFQSYRYKFSERIKPALRRYLHQNDVSVDNNGFRELLYVIEQEAEEDFGNVEKIVIPDKGVTQGVEISGVVYDIAPPRVKRRIEEILDSLEPLCYTKGIKILSVGFLIQAVGSAHIAMTV